MKELVIISGKGGTGKTSIVASFAALAKQKLMVDCDVDAADLHLVLTPTVEKREEFIGGKVAQLDGENCTGCGVCMEVCRFDAVEVKQGDVYTIDEISCEGCGVCALSCPVEAISMEDAVSGEWFISATRHGPMIHGKLGVGGENSGKMVALLREQAKQLAEREGLELIIVDGSPGIGCAVIASITGADQVLIVAEPTVTAIHDLRRVSELARNFKIPTALCINKWEINPDLSAQIEAECAETGIQFVGKIPYDPAVVGAQLEALTVVEFAQGALPDAIGEVWKKTRQAME